MILAHLWPSPFLVALRVKGYWSGADGFFLISGAVLGIYYRGKLDLWGLPKVTRTLWKRAVELGLANLGIALLWAARDRWRLSDTAFERVWGEPWWHSLLHLEPPYLLHVLPRYTVFLLIAPAVLALLRRRHTASVVLVSLTLWLVGLADWREPGLPGLEPGFTRFPVMSWQMIFFLGVVMGWHRRRIARWWNRVEGWPLALALAVGVAVFQKLRLDHLATGQPFIEPGALWIGRPVLGPLRLVALAITFAFIFLLVDRLWQPLERWTGGLLLVLGQNAFYVYLLHLLFVMIFHPLPRHLPSISPIGWMAADLAVLWLLWAMTRYRTQLKSALGRLAPGSG